MKATIELTKRTALEEMIIRNNKSEMLEMVAAKQKALAEAKESGYVRKGSDFDLFC